MDGGQEVDGGQEGKMARDDIKSRENPQVQTGPVAMSGNKATKNASAGQVFRLVRVPVSKVTSWNHESQI